jgi:pyruvate/2-oxoglutarate dehydrogenase complex dihydrolipoamide acyltransferase (E2) component
VNAQSKPVVLAPLSSTMEDGYIERWLVSDGSPVRTGEAIAEVETDKATVQLEATASGFLHIIVDEGASVPVGTVLARIENEPV